MNLRVLTSAALALGLCLIVYGATAWADSADATPDSVPVPATLADFFLPGTQPETITETLVSATHFTTEGTPCIACHGLFESPEPDAYRMWDAWSGSMMAQSARDPLFLASLDQANADVAGAGEWCLRCHSPQGWMEGASEPDGSLIEAEPEYREGVQCSICHRLVDREYAPGVSPPVDLAIIEAIDPPLTFTGSGALILDPLDRRRAAREDVLEAHPVEVSPYHEEAALCGSCHDISNPLLTWDDAVGEYVLNTLDAPFSADGPYDDLFPVERTYSEWLNSAFPGEDTTCQTCHFQPVTARLAVGAPLRTDMAFHDMTGGNVWVPQTILCEAGLWPGCADYAGAGRFAEDFQFTAGALRATAIYSGMLRAEETLQNAATLAAAAQSGTLTVTVTNETGHKLPTGYPEGRRMWLQIEAVDAEGAVVYTSGAYDVATGELIADPDLQTYEIEPGITCALAADAGLALPPQCSDGDPDNDFFPSFRFALNNIVINDNRIPPRGFTNATFDAARAGYFADGQPAAVYADGEYWDTVAYALPPSAVAGTVRLLYQTASKEYIDFLDANDPFAADPDSRTNILVDLWERTNRGAPVLMAEQTFTVSALPPHELSVSLAEAADVDGLAVNPGDVIAYTSTSDSWAMRFDAAAAGVSGANVDAFLVYQDSFLLSFDAPTAVPGLGTVDDSDVVLYDPVGNSYLLALDGSDVGLTTEAEDIDAIAIAANTLAVSTRGAFAVPGLSGDDEDLIVLENAQFGPVTSGSWAMFFDGSDVGLGSGEARDVDAAWYDAADGALYLSAAGSFSLAGLTVASNDIGLCALTLSGPQTACAPAASGVPIVGDVVRLTGNVDAVALAWLGAPAQSVPALDRLWLSAR